LNVFIDQARTNLFPAVSYGPAYFLSLAAGQLICESFVKAQ